MPKKPTKSQQMLAKTYRVSVKTITRWRLAGAPLDNPAGMAQWLEQGRRTAVLPGTATARQADSRAEFYRVQALRVALKLEKEKGELLRADIVQDSIARAMGIMFSELDRIFASDFPSVCRGMDEAGIRARAIDAIERTKSAFREALGKPGALQ